MSLSQGRSYLAIPGPSVMPDSVLRAMQRPAPNIYEGAMPDMMPQIIADLKMVAGTKHYCAPYIGNGHFMWEVALSNVMQPGDKALCLATGYFGLSWGDMARGLGIQIDLLDFGRTEGIDLERLAQTLRDDKSHQIKAILMTHVDTSTTRKNDPKAIRAVLDATDHPALLMLDSIAALGCDEYHMDAWGVDVTIAACQKGLMTPPGLGFVFYNERAAALRQKQPRVGIHYDWTLRGKGGILASYFNGTAPTHLIYALRAALDLIKEEGMTHIWHRHAVLAQAIWAACDKWGQNGPLRLHLENPADRSHAVTAARLEKGMGTALRHWLETNSGVTLGIGLGMSTEDDPDSTRAFRFGHMGHVNAHMVLGMLACCDMGMKALGIPHGDGAIEAATQICAESFKNKAF